MRKLMNRLYSTFSSTPSLPTAGDSLAPGGENPEDVYWQEVYRAREAVFREHLGEPPDNIIKMGNLFGVWPGGGLFAFPASKVGSDAWAYTTFGLTNPDMPAGVTASNVATETDAAGRVVQCSSTLQSKEKASTPAEAAGYGYELLVLTCERADWPLWLLQWAVNAELLSDVGLLKRVEHYHGLTVEDVQVGEAESVNILIAKAQSPLPSGLTLPNGKMELLVATTITDEEMRWSLEVGRPALLEKLMAAGAGQFSERRRTPVWLGRS